jgi:hypothetical protein
MDHIVLLAGVAALLMIATVGTAAWWLARAARRLSRRLLKPGVAAARNRDAVGARRRIAGVATGRSGVQAHELGLRAAAARPRANPAWWSAQHERRSLRRSVAAAERTVAAAVAADAPVGELPGLCGELRRVHGDVDRQLMLAALHGEPPGGQALAQAAKARASARQIRSMAARVHAETSMPTADELAARVDSEAVALTAGLSSLRETRTAR